MPYLFKNRDGADLSRRRINSPSASVSVPDVNPYPPAQWQNSLVLDTVNERVDFGNNLTNDGTSAFTWQGYLKFTVTGGTQIIMSKLNSGNKGWEVNVNGSSGKPTLYIINSAGADWLNSECNLAIATNTWTHIAVTYDGSKTFGGIKWYVNGVLQSTTNNGAATLVGSSSSTGTLMLNARNGNLFGDAPMTYKEIAYHTSELTGLNILTMYNSGLPTDLLLTPTPPNYLWRCGDTGGDDATGGSGIITDTGTEITNIHGTPVNTEFADIIVDAP